ncbi:MULTISPECIES: hypothetical protein [Polaribacter]|uniref:hypothetical protein n=1 Tax=Polaribacter TaxID=52959 RepID=UPI00209154EC|nr:MULTISPECIES: hypothetical protein [Polaribacter]MDO6741555.1 hypothetical protein [Polaribacter sp. 1_MG-2023]
MKNKLTLLLLLVPFYFFAQTTNNTNFKTISGFIKHKDKALSNVTIFVENTMRYAISDTNGFYTIKAKIGETLSYSYSGYLKTYVIVEDVSETLNINMIVENKSSKLRFNSNPKLGDVNIGENVPEFGVIKIDGKSLNKYATSLTRALVEKLTFFYIKFNKYGEETLYLKGKEFNGSAVWLIDNYEFDIPFPILISEVKEIIVMNSEKNNPVIRVSTNIDYKKLKNIDFNNYFFTDDDFYSYDAKKVKKLKNIYPFLDKYKKISKEKEALELFENTYKKDKNNKDYFLNIYKYFKDKKFDNTFLSEILSTYEKEANNNPETLKAIAYKYQEINEDKKAIEVYKKIIKLRPNYLQSFRDLANAFLEQKEYNEFWKTYHYFLNKGYKVKEDDIGEIIASEIITVYNLDIENDNNRKKIKIENPNKNVKSDVRLVFEWNTTEAEFIIEFVNPYLATYKIENSFKENQSLIKDQKIKGYTSKEIFIDKLIPGFYLVNLTYLGNKQEKPTTFKITTYYNWGKENQSKKIKVFDFSNYNVKHQLIKLSRKYL